MSLSLGFGARFVHQGCGLRKSLYELKKSPRAWFYRFSTSIKSQGYTQGHSDHTLFIKVSKFGKLTVLIVYVDDIVLSSDDTDEILWFKRKMGDEFAFKDLGNLKCFLGMEIARFQVGIFISHQKYTLDLLTETENLPPTTVLLCEAILLLREARSKKLLLGVVLKLNIGP
ncbi:Cysteine-rich RLK (receptor-like protein kinase) 8 [Cucumis melo var. makuwa]|uniref:Cysteine-rich RLK (Receptor-like protein kinase) 8 n=1 Tax=Cucumis melo var. makuwa TaxID=1194695 RepID=A0A5D3DQN5_CUCMM|nr:Cysteine-rich RLK (receptor-like protein kinase) 8 [Cucumis melo var. makuwa]